MEGDQIHELLIGKWSCYSSRAFSLNFKILSAIGDSNLTAEAVFSMKSIKEDSPHGEVSQKLKVRSIHYFKKFEGFYISFSIENSRFQGMVNPHTRQMHGQQIYLDPPCKIQRYFYAVKVQ